MSLAWNQIKNLCEDGIAANSLAGGGVAMYEPLLKRMGKKKSDMVDPCDNSKIMNHTGPIEIGAQGTTSPGNVYDNGNTNRNPLKRMKDVIDGNKKAIIPGKGKPLRQIAGN